MSENWTPGPWVVDPMDSRLVTTLSGEVISTAHGRDAEALANGILNAAGPELYEACRLVEIYHDDEGDVSAMLRYAEAIDAVKKALRKARGEN